VTTPAENRLAAGIAADLLAVGAGIDAASRLVTAGALAAGVLALPLAGSPLLLLAVLPALALGAVEMVYAARVGLDAALFRRLAGDGHGDTPDLAAFDRAMLRLGLVPGHKTGRPIEARIAGAKRLLAIQAAAFAAQIALPLPVAALVVAVR
jgi:hypothetical protein